MMKLIVDTNRLIAALVKDSYSRRILLHFPAEFILISHNEKEVMKHQEEILHKSGLSAEKFAILFQSLKERCIKIEDQVIQEQMEEAKKIMESIDPDDTPFIAAALAAKAEIWSDDTHFQKQQRVKAWRTKDLVSFL